jgi:hypothetical protein
MNNLNKGQGQGWPPPEPPPLSGGLVAAMVALAIVVPLLGPAVAVAVGAMSLPRRGAKTVVWTGGVLLAISVVVIMMIPAFLIAAPNFEKIRLKSHEAETKQNLHAVWMALEQYGIEHEGVFPPEMKSPDEMTYFRMRSFRCHNPMTGKEMQPVSFGTQPCAGEFTYIPVEVDGQVKGYYLLAYGYESTPGEDVNGDGEPDHVILVLCSGTSGDNPEDWVDSTSDGKPLPPLEELLQGRPAETE